MRCETHEYATFEPLRKSERSRPGRSRSAHHLSEHTDRLQWALCYWWLRNTLGYGRHVHFRTASETDVLVHKFRITHPAVLSTTRRSINALCWSDERARIRARALGWNLWREPHHHLVASEPWLLRLLGGGPVLMRGSGDAECMRSPERRLARGEVLQERGRGLERRHGNQAGRMGALPKLAPTAIVQPHLRRNAGGYSTLYYTGYWIYYCSLLHCTYCRMPLSWNAGG